MMLLIIQNLRCGCPEGFILHNVFQECVDANECLDSQTEESLSTCGSAKCQNSFGSYSCLCPSGYSFNGNLKVCVQSASGCGEASCSFGCNPVGSTGFDCQCPRGHQVSLTFEMNNLYFCNLVIIRPLREPRDKFPIAWPSIVWTILWRLMRNRTLFRLKDALPAK